VKTLSYKGYQASVEFDDGVLFVKVLHLDDLLIGECDAASDAPKVLEDLVEAYLADCAEAGRKPSKPFKGSFNVRIPPDLHRKAAMRAAENGLSLNGWIQKAVEEKVEEPTADVSAAA
jgi:predicted HicB family RNase H-like nuclease